MRLPRVLILFVLLFPISALGQDVPGIGTCAYSKINLFNSSHKLTVAAAEEEHYDVQYVKFDIRLTNENTSISGSVTTRARVKGQDALEQYVFELNSQLTVDSVKINEGVPLIVNTNVATYVRTATLFSPVPPGDIFTAQVFYHGSIIPEPYAALYSMGLLNDTSWKTKATFTYSEPYRSRDWWPCKQSLTDKIDSADIWITVPKGLKAGSNGRLAAVTQFADSSSRFEWKTAYPTDYYLFSAAVAPYIDYSYKAPIPGLKDSVLVQNFIYQNPDVLKKWQPQIDSVGLMISYLSELLGPYPFYKEKYGHCIVPLWGGMEHQTMTTLGDFGSTLVVHELGHQWFGDHVTCATWKDIWLNEGFASYIEYLFKDHFYGAKAAAEHMRAFHEKLLAKTAQWGSIYGDDTTSSDRIFDNRLSYSKPAAVIHTLRFVINNDSLFFALLKAYQSKFAFSTASTEDFKKLAEQLTGLNLSTFFDQWIYKQGYPVFGADWNQVGEKVFVRLDQASMIPQSLNLFKTPVAIKLHSRNGDTIIRVSSEEPSTLYRITWDKMITGIEIDPDNWLLNGESGVYRNFNLGLSELSVPSITLFPNPTTGDWYLFGLKEAYNCRLTDIRGHIIWQGTNGNDNNMSIPGKPMAAGLYFLQLSKGKDIINTYKLSKLSKP